ncbi:carbon-nitrogen hydrolase family protein [Terrisporobacter sp.]
MKLAMAQISMELDIDSNYEKTVEYVEKAKDCDLLFFPEIQLGPFFPQYEKSNLQKALGKDISKFCITMDDKRIAELKKLSKKNNLYLSPNFYIEENKKRYDMSLFINSRGELEGVSKMVHILNAKRFYEEDYYTPSEDGFKVFDTSYGKVGIVICFDRHLPESIRTCAMKGAELIIIPTANTKAEPLDIFEWELRVAAYQNNVFVAMCNRVGKEGKMDFAGESIVIDCNGNLVFKADDKEQLVTADIDLSKCKNSRKNRPYINLRRREMYL